MLIISISITFIYIRGNFEKKIELIEQVLRHDFDDICQNSNNDSFIKLTVSVVQFDAAPIFSNRKLRQFSLLNNVRYKTVPPQNMYRHEHMHSGVKISWARNNLFIRSRLFPF